MFEGGEGMVMRTSFCLYKGSWFLMAATLCVAAMVDSGATVLFLNKKYTDRQKIRMVLLERSISLYNIDRTLNEAGSIMHKARLNLKVGSEVHQHDFYVTQIGPEKVILWLCMRNPSIQWLK